MDTITLLSWNVNGIRAAYKKGFLDWLHNESPDILCIQETKAHLEQLPKSLQTVPDYHTYYVSADRKGYSGVAIFSKHEPNQIKKGFGIQEFDKEGRVIIADFKHYILLNIYFPNGKASPERLSYKMAFYDAFLDLVDTYKSKNKKIIICGDVNTAHKEIDLTRSKENEHFSGFLPEERAWIDQFLSHGYLDTFRIFNQDGGHYTWWDYKTRARERNVGWRIDYFFISKNLKDNIQSSFIYSEVMGSDHCPIGIHISI